MDEEKLLSMMPDVTTGKQLSQQADSYYLSTMSRRIFRAGLKYAIVDNKWPAFEEAFFGFNPLRVAMMTDEELDELMANRAIIRHWNKIKSVRTNAAMCLEIQEQHGSVGQWLAEWPTTDIISLWTYMKKNGAQLGGRSGQYFLRMVGKDTFILTKDVVTALIAQGIVDKEPTSQKDLRKTQDAFNEWAEQGGKPLSHISRLLSMTVNY